mmetsp:Transcript_34283/g.94668  ORF Transcript_34283/g.94668 Transcript_34283/m.94668 type:complete len:246 (-) Transcript_34283:288-1025(-)
MEGSALEQLELWMVPSSAGSKMRPEEGMSPRFSGVGSRVEVTDDARRNDPPVHTCSPRFSGVDARVELADVIIHSDPGGGDGLERRLAQTSRLPAMLPNWKSSRLRFEAAAETEKRQLVRPRAKPWLSGPAWSSESEVSLKPSSTNASSSVSASPPRASPSLPSRMHPDGSSTSIADGGRLKSGTPSRSQGANAGFRTGGKGSEGGAGGVGNVMGPFWRSIMAAQSFKIGSPAARGPATTSPLPK